MPRASRRYAPVLQPQYEYLRCSPGETCAELKAECGSINNSCGSPLFCGSCQPGSECDKITNRCKPCTNPKPSDLGFECGMVFLGCGDDTTDKVDAGTCTTGYTCNSINHLCEPTCTPKSTTELCLAANANCGEITNGCGGTVNCGKCPDKQSCAAAGTPNRCEVPPTPNECLAANRNCGIMTSVCRDGGMGGPLEVDCGSCIAPGEVCNENGRCGPPCTSTQCGTGDLIGHCGKGIDAGCQFARDCVCPGSLTCSTNQPGVLGDCVQPQACSKFTSGDEGAPCSNGPSPTFPTGVGGNLTCQCMGTGICINSAKQIVKDAETGTCCVNQNICGPDDCNKTVTDSCTGVTTTCGCTGNTFCNKNKNKCEPPNTCASLGAVGTRDAPCTLMGQTSPALPKDATTNLSCPCGNGGLCNVPGTVTQVTGDNAGKCCYNTAFCAPDECNTVKFDTCTGIRVDCSCKNSGTHCNNNTNRCEADNNCSALTTGGVGATCSNGPSSAFPTGSTGTDGKPILLACSCTQPGTGCFNGSTELASGSSTAGKCCLKGTCAPGACNQTYTETCSGQTLPCPDCPSFQYCSSQTCKPLLTCASHGALGIENSPCSNANAFSNGRTVALTCGCAAGYSCSSNGQLASGTQQGKCCVDTDFTCTRPDGSKVCGGTKTNKCTGATMTCACGNGEVCDTSTSTCKSSASACTANGATGASGSRCSTSPNSAFPGFPGDTTGVTCNCVGSGVCVINGRRAAAGEVGTCCSPAGCGSTCNSPIGNSCVAGENLQCGGCPGGQYCDPNSKTCSTYLNCQSYISNVGAQGSQCSTQGNPSWPAYTGDTRGLVCYCNSGLECYNSSGQPASTSGNCCKRPNCPYNTCASVYDECTKTNVACTCAGGNYCKNGSCTPNLTCESYGARGQTGNPCSNARAFDAGDGSKLHCGCADSSFQCVSGGTVVSGTATGTCQKAATCSTFGATGAAGAPCGGNFTSSGQTFTCGCNSGLSCSSGGRTVTGTQNGTCCQNTNTCNGRCSYVDSCTGQTVGCGCSAGTHCDTASNSCVTDKTCANYGANGSINNPCSNSPNPAFPGGPSNNNLSCTCSTSGNYNNIQCVGATSSNAGTCQCTPTVGNCGQNGQSNGCGGTISATCPSPQKCHNNACCTPKTCLNSAGATSTGQIGEPCGTFPDGCGGDRSCQQCDIGGTPNKANNMCDPTTQVCKCTPFGLGECTTRGWKGSQPDGCGGFVNCPS